MKTIEEKLTERVTAELDMVDLESRFADMLDECYSFEAWARHVYPSASVGCQKGGALMTPDTIELKTIETFIAEQQITMDVQPTDHNPHMDDFDADHWRCTLRCGGRSMQLTYSMGKGHNGKAPIAADVLDSLASDSAGVEGVTFEDWAQDLGYDTDSRKALKTYNVCVRQMRSLGRLLGADAYADLLWNTVRL